MDKNINEQLLDAQKDWVELIFKPFVQKYTNHGVCKDTKRADEVISCPFYFGLTDEYILTDKKRIMIVGQEARGFGNWERDKNTRSYQAEYSQAWAKEYLQKQIGNNFTSKFGIKYNHSNFWQLFRVLSKDFAVCWNNIDKVYYGKDGSYKGTLTTSAEKFLSARYPSYNEIEEKSLLQREIQIAKPNMVLFLTGPTYHVSMETAFDLNENSLIDYRPKKSRMLSNISDIIKISTEDAKFIPVLWSYHPNFICRNKTIEDFVNDIKIALNI